MLSFLLRIFNCLVGDVFMNYESVSHLKKICGKYEIISFDIFDTLLKRDVYNSTDVFKIVGQIEGIEDFYNKRINAEKAARKKEINGEVTLEDIYNEIEYTRELANSLQCRELEVEKGLLHKNYPIYEVFIECIKLKKKVYLCSDMYLPKSFLIDILYENDIIGFRKILISGEYKAKKKTGELFKKLCEEENIDYNKVLHIGDSKYADYVAPRKLGMHAYYIKKRQKNTNYINLGNNVKTGDKAFYSFINNRIRQFKRRDQIIGYEIVGPIIYSYCEWLQKETDNSDEIILFAARDMYFFYKSFIHMYGKRERIKYIYISRKSLRPAYTYIEKNILKSQELFTHDKWSLSELLQRLGYPENIISTLDDEKYEKKYYADKLEEYKELKDILHNAQLQVEEKDRAKKVIEYLNECGLFSSNIILADVGWHGRTQFVLSEIQNEYNSALSIKGYYIGNLKGTNERIGINNSKTLYFDENAPSMFSKGIMIFERMIAAPEGTTIGYDYKENAIIPVLAEAEELDVCIRNIQQSALKFIEDYRLSYLHNYIQTPKRLIRESFENLISNPRIVDLRMIGDFRYDTGDGYLQLAHPKTLMYYIIHPRVFYKELKYSPWRIGFLKRLFRLPINYGKIYSLIRTLVGKDT